MLVLKVSVMLSFLFLWRIGKAVPVESESTID